MASRMRPTGRPSTRCCSTWTARCSIWVSTSVSGRKRRATGRSTGTASSTGATHSPSIAHPEMLAIKDAHLGLRRRVDAAYSSHELGEAKECPGFWPRLAARLHGIEWPRPIPPLNRPAVPEGRRQAVRRHDAGGGAGASGLAQPVQPVPEPEPAERPIPGPRCAAARAPVADAACHRGGPDGPVHGCDGGVGAAQGHPPLRHPDAAPGNQA